MEVVILHTPRLSAYPSKEGMKKAETFAGLGFLCFRVSMHYYISESFL